VLLVLPNSDIHVTCDNAIKTCGRNSQQLSRIRSYLYLLALLKKRELNSASFAKALPERRLQKAVCPKKISIITPSFNQAQYLEDTIQSVLKQKYKNYEHIIVDGASTDGTIEILKRYPHLKWISEKDSGQSEALNKGLRMATGDIIGIINSDDYYSRNAFNWVLRAVSLNKDARVFLGNCKFIYEGTRRNFVINNKDLTFDDVIRYWDTWIPPTQPAIFFMRELIDEFGYFDCSLDKAMDYDLWLRFARVHKFHHIPKTLAVYRFHNESKSGMGEDWSSFYDEWHQVYLKNKRYSRKLSQLPLISIVLYHSNCIEDDFTNHKGLESYIKYINNQRLKDIELIIITDSNELEGKLKSSIRIAHRIACVSSVSTQSFADAIRQYAHGSFVHCPTFDAIYPDRWYCDNVSKLLDNSCLANAGEPDNNTKKHPFLPVGASVTANTLIRYNKYIFSVIIPTYNRSSVLIKCLAALAGQDFPFKDFEVLVCDDGSTDDTEASVRKFTPPYSLHYLKKENGGPSAARNMGIRAAQGEFLLILNDDAILTTNALTLHKAALDSFLNRKIAVLGKFSLAPEFAVTPFGYLLESTDKLFAYPTMKGHQLYDFSYFYTCNISISRQAVIDAGLFDEDFKGPAAEDIELGFRLQQQGYKVYYHPDILAHHDHEVTPASFYRTHKVRSKWGMLFMFKHPNASTWYNHYNLLQVNRWDKEHPIQYAKAQTAIQHLEKIEKEYIQSPQPHKLATIARDMLPQVQFIQTVAEIDGFLDSPLFHPYLNGKYGTFVSKLITLPKRLRISVVIPTYNRRDILLKCLEVLSSQSMDSSFFEVLVCDDGSTDGTYEALLQFRAKYSLQCFRQENSGPAVARNRAILAASADLILILNDDAILHPDALLIHLEEHSSRSNQKVAVLGHFSLHPEYNDLDSPVGHALQHSDLIFDYKFMKPGRKYNHLFFYTCNISLNKKYLMEVGLFDASIGTAGAEDIELGYRLYRNGLSVVYRPDCIAWHAHRLVIDGLAKMFITRGKGGVLLFLRHPELPRHYRGICMSKAHDVKERHERLAPFISELGEMVNRFNSISFSPPQHDIALSEKGNGINFKLLWQASENEVRMAIEKLIQDLRLEIAHQQATKISICLDDAARSVYPSLTFIKWYYDTLGVADSSFLGELIEIEKETRSNVNMFMTSFFNYFQRKVKGEDYRYRR
jgi:glycosyltransferase involved in cell wall biosynthesis